MASEKKNPTSTRKEINNFPILMFQIWTWGNEFQKFPTHFHFFIIFFSLSVSRMITCRSCPVDDTHLNGVYLRNVAKWWGSMFVYLISYPTSLSWGMMCKRPTYLLLGNFKFVFFFLLKPMFFSSGWKLEKRKIWSAS